MKGAGTPHWHRREENRSASGQNFRDDLATVDGRAFVAAVVEEGELLMFHAEQVKERGMNVVDVRPPFDRPQADFVGRAKNGAAFDAAARHPNGETPGVMVA